MKLSQFLKSPTPLHEDDIHCILLELAIRQETVERVMADRMNVLLTGLEGICTCSWSLDVKQGQHLSICPMGRAQAEGKVELDDGHHEEVSDSKTTVSGSLTRAQLLRSLYSMKAELDSTDPKDIPDDQAEAAMQEADALAIAIKLAETHYKE